MNYGGRNATVLRTPEMNKKNEGNSGCLASPLGSEGPDLLFNLALFDRLRSKRAHRRRIQDRLGLTSLQPPKIPRFHVSWSRLRRLAILTRFAFTVDITSHTRLASPSTPRTTNTVAIHPKRRRPSFASIASSCGTHPTTASKCFQPSHFTNNPHMRQSTGR